MSVTSGFKCFHCGAPLDVPADRNATVTCEYCGMTSTLSPPVASPISAFGPAGGRWAVLLESVGAKKIAVIKAVREINGLGLKETKDLVESAPVVIRRGIDQEQAEAAQKMLSEAGATVRIGEG